MIEFLTDITVILKDVKLKSAGRVHLTLGKMCAGDGCKTCDHYNNLWKQFESARGRRKEKLRNEARRIMPVARFFYTSDRGDFKTGETVHLKIEEFGPNISIRKTLINFGGESYPYYEVKQI